jgi:pilus assembly protein CpaC
MEVSRTKLRTLGIDWALLSPTSDGFVSNAAGILSGSAAGAVTSTGTQTVSLSVVDGNTRFQSSIEALRRNNLVKVLASPILTAVDGRPASFNSGGEIPIIVPAGLGQVGIQFREFGTRLDYVAKVLGNGKIYLEVRPYVSEIDPTRSVEIEGISVPGLRSRFLETGVELHAGQTLALAGLLQVRTETISQGIPGLSEVPYLGALFRKTREEQNEIELLITVTPDFAGPMDPSQVPCMAPGMGTQSPTDKELYFKGYMETPVNGAPQSTPPSGLFESVPTPMNSVGLSPTPSARPSGISVGPNTPTLAESQFRNASGTSFQTAVTPTAGAYR